MHRAIGSMNDWDWVRGLVTSAFVVGVVWLLAGCSLVNPACEGPCTCPDRAAEVEPVWDKLAVEVASLGEQRPTGVAVASDGRTFLAFPWAEDAPDDSVVELAPDGMTRPYPSASWSAWDGESGPSALRSFVCVQTVYADDENNLWVLDSGNPRNRRGVVPGGPKLVKIDLETDTITDVVYFDSKRFLDPDSYLAGLCVDTRTQTAYTIDASDGEVYVVDLQTEAMHRVSLDKPAAEPRAFTMSYAPGAALLALAGDAVSATGLEPSRSTLAGLALSADGDWLYYHTDGERVCRVATDKLRDRTLTDGIRSAAVEDLGEVETRISGVWLDAQDNLYMAAVDGDAVYVRSPSGGVDTVLADPRLAQADALAGGPGGYVYFTALKRDAFEVPCGQTAEHTARVLKFSPQKIALAEQRRQGAEDLHTEAAWYRKLAEDAEQLAAESERVAEEKTNQAKAVIASAESASASGEGVTQAMREATQQAVREAKQARQSAEDDRTAAEQLRARSQAAREAAALAERQAADAEFAELDAERPGDTGNTGLADVPTTTD